MKALIQRVTQASVSVANKTIGQIEAGLLVFLGITHNDSSEDIDYLARKIINMRIFTDSDDKFNLSLIDTKGAILIVSQFTLLASTKKGNRPGFTDSAPPTIAIPLYEEFIEKVKKHIPKVETGSFGASMQVSLENDGPVTIMIDSQKKS